jgi:hypothetical protein
MLRMLSLIRPTEGVAFEKAAVAQILKVTHGGARIQRHCSTVERQVYERSSYTK